MFGLGKKAPEQGLNVEVINDSGALICAHVLRPDAIRTGSYRIILPTRVSGGVQLPWLLRPPPSADLSTVAVGAKCGSLTQVGDLWIDFDAVEAVTFSPADKCGAEVQFKSGKTSHYSEFGAACLRKYLQQPQAEIAELERMNRTAPAGVTYTND